MSFSEITGNEYLTGRLRSIAASGEIHNAYIFEGPMSADKLLVAKQFAKAILCREKPGEGCNQCRICRSIDDGNYADVTVIEAENAEIKKAKQRADIGEEPDFSAKKFNKTTKSIKADDIRELQARLSRRPVEGDRQIAIVKDADTIRNATYDIFLKTLEEPPEGTVIMLLSENADTLPLTISSRCVKLRVLPFGAKSNRKAMKRARELVGKINAGDTYVSIKKTIEKTGRDKNEAYALLDCMEDIYREKFTEAGAAGRGAYFRAVELIEESRERIARDSNVQYTLKSLALRIGG